MKKNTMMRVASVMLMAVLLTTSAISGTFAKYVTSDSGSDSARVAKFGVVLSIADSSNFKTEYATNDTNYSGTVSVQSSNTDKLVAPGTKDDTGITFSITGTPEVATKVDISMDVTDDVFLKAATGYNDYTLPKTAPTATTPADWQNFDLTADYYPVVFTLKQGTNTIESGNLTAIKTAIEDYASNAYYAPNTNLNATFTLTWEWIFAGNDKADTWLGNAAADASAFAEGKTAGIGNDYDLNIDYTLTISVTQVD